MVSMSKAVSVDIDKLRKIYPKYKDYSFIPIVRGIVGIGLFAFTSLIIKYKYFINDKMLKLPRNGWFLLFYLFGIFICRIYETKTTSVCFELLWGCNTSLFLSSIGCFIGSPLLISISLNLIGLDQLIWHFDILSYFLFRKCIIGAAGYLFFKEMGYIRIITSLHHLWFIWFCLNCLKNGKSYLINGSFKISMFIGVLSMIFARATTPKCCWFPIPQNKKKDLLHSSSNIIDKDKHLYLEYLNINCGYEFYPTVNISILHYFNNLPSYLYIPVIASFLTVLSYLPHKLLKIYSDKYLYSNP